MSSELYPLAELGVLWLQATLTVALCWLLIRTEFVPVIVACAVVYTSSILVWLALVHLDIPVIWGLEIEGRAYPAVELGAAGFVLAFGVLFVLRRRRVRGESLAAE